MKNRLLLSLFLFGMIFPGAVTASPWAEKDGYFAKAGGKFSFGLKQSLFSWMTPWAEANDPKYKTQWSGFCAGIGKIIPYTAGGLIQLVTFPVPVDFPDLGEGLHSPTVGARHVGFNQPEDTAAPAQPAGETADQAMATAVAMLSPQTSQAPSAPTTPAAGPALSPEPSAPLEPSISEPDPAIK